MCFSFTPSIMLEEEALPKHKDLTPSYDVFAHSMEGHRMVAFAIIDLEPKEG